MDALGGDGDWFLFGSVALSVSSEGGVLRRLGMGRYEPKRDDSDRFS